MESEGTSGPYPLLILRPLYLYVIDLFLHDSFPTSRVTRRLTPCSTVLFDCRTLLLCSRRSSQMLDPLIHAPHLSPGALPNGRLYRSRARRRLYSGLSPVHRVPVPTGQLLLAAAGR